MAAYSRQLLSGSTSGKPIPIVATATIGTTIHTATAVGGAFDEIYCWVNNTSAAAVTMTVEWGAAGTGSQMVTAYSIPANSSSTPITFGQVLNGGLLCTMFASVANALNVTGFVNRIV